MQTIDKHFRNLTAAAFKNHGFAQGDVLAQWPQIVGADIAAIARPEKIRFGRSEAGGGTLHLKVLPGRVLDLQYQAATIAAKVNAFLGYAAISALKLVQAHDFEATAVKRSRSIPVPPAVSAQVAHVKDPELAAALARLGAGISAENPRSPQAK